MPFSYREWIFGGKTFCCCLPVRFGVISMSVLGILGAGLLSIAMWYEVSVSATATAGVRAAFAIAGVTETILFLASILGFVGAIVHKQSFIQTYAYILYVHFFLNIGVAGYLLFIITQFQESATQAACDNTITDPTTQDQCRGLLRITTTIFIVLAALILLVEMYGAIIVTRHLNLVRRKKRLLKESKRSNDDAFSLQPLNLSFYGNSRRSQSYASLDQREEEFNPYAETRTVNRSLMNDDDEEFTRPAPPIEVGYGGGIWTHREITDEEKSRLERSERGSPIVSPDNLTDAQREQRLSDVKSPYGPSEHRSEDSLPEYIAFPNAASHRPRDN